MTAWSIYRNYVRFIGVGAIATAGIIGIIKSLRIVAGSFGIALRTFRHGEAAQTERTDRDIPIIFVLLAVILSADRPWRPSLDIFRLLDGSRRGPGIDAALLVLLYFSGGQRHCDNGSHPVSG